MGAPGIEQPCSEVFFAHVTPPVAHDPGARGRISLQKWIDSDVTKMA
jgi:hypothetical protein